MTPEAAKRFIRANLALRAPPGLASIQLYTAHAGSGLRRLAGASAPYWAYPWPGGIALARYFLENGSIVAGKRVLDLGCGGGLVGIAAAQAGAAAVYAADTDPLARLAASLNAQANGVSVSVFEEDLSTLRLAEIDLAAAGDVFYARPAARRMIGYLRACRTAGIEVLVGDPGRRHLPRALLSERASYAVTDFANVATTGTVFAFQPAASEAASGRVAA